jgi:hypothetical protein
MFRKLLLFILSSVMIPSVAAAQRRSDYPPSGLGIYTGIPLATTYSKSTHAGRISRLIFRFEREAEKK